MLTLVLATQKGGSGKSTLAIGLALAAVQAGHTVRLIETDSQGTLSNWQARRVDAEPIVEPVYKAREIEQRLQSLERSGVTLTIIDTPGGINAATTEAIRYSDFCLIPARPSIADIEATAPTLHVIRAWKKPFAFVLNQTPIRGHRISNAATDSRPLALDRDQAEYRPTKRFADLRRTGDRHRIPGSARNRSRDVLACTREDGGTGFLKLYPFKLTRTITTAHSLSN